VRLFRSTKTLVLREPDQTKRVNYRNVQIDAVGVGLANAAAPFLPVFLTRMGATSFQVGLLTAMPALTGLVLAIVIGNFLQRQRNIVPWYSAARLMVISSYALTGIIPFLVPREWAVPAVLAIWALATFPQIIVNVAFSVVMNAVAGPEGRYDLMSRRWSILGFTSAITVAVAGQVLELLDFPLDYQVVFMGLSLGGLISYYYSSNIKIPDSEPVPVTPGLSPRKRVRNYLELVWSQKPFVRFAGMRLVFLSGAALSAPLFPLYYVREVAASDAWIGAINFAQTFVLLVGYFVWTRLSRRRGGRYVLLRTTLGLALYPALVALTPRVELLVLYAGIAGILQAGVDLVFFDELMKTVPVKYSPTFVSLAQSLQYLSAVIAPIAGSWMADSIGIGWGLVISGGLRLVGFALFALYGSQEAAPAVHLPEPPPPETPAQPE
jgi:hypothetical protein